MEDKSKELEITCPFCGKIKNINVPETIFSQKKFGTIKIQVPPGAVCSEHQFIVFADYKGNIRGYEKIDIQMGLPTEETAMEAAGILTLRKFIQMIGTYGVFSIIHSKIFNYPAYIIIDKDFNASSNLMNLIGDRLLPEKYRDIKSIHLLEETDYNKIKLEEKDSLLLDTHQHILQTPWEEKLKFEESMVKKALEIIDAEEQLIVLQQDITNFIKEAEYTKDILEDLKEIYEDDLIDKISTELMTPKISHYRFDLIKQFIKRRFSPELTGKIKNKVEEFLDLL